MMKKRNASSLIYLIFFFVIFLAFCTFAVDGTIVLSDRAKLQNATESVALAAATEFVNGGDASLSATNIFNKLKHDRLEHATINVQVNTATKQVLVTTENISQPFFLAFLGLTGIKLEAKACAESKELPVTALYGDINWISASAAYFSDILSKDVNLNDTAILPPLGNFASYSYDKATGMANFALIDSQDNKPLSLGPGGFITIKLPAPIIDKPGNDLFIKEIGALEGYFVFAGLDNEPTNPYIQYDKPGAKISWVNISCSGAPEKKDLNNFVGAYSTSTNSLGSQVKMYGSAYFDLNDSCITGTQGDISMAKYIRIIDDNEESSFMTRDESHFYKTIAYGEASTNTPGADIDAVSVLNDVTLTAPSNFTMP